MILGDFCLALVINWIYSVINFKNMFYSVAFGNEKVIVWRETHGKDDVVLMITCIIDLSKCSAFKNTPIQSCVFVISLSLSLHPCFRKAMHPSPWLLRSLVSFSLRLSHTHLELTKPRRRNDTVFSLNFLASLQGLPLPPRWKLL